MHLRLLALIASVPLCAQHSETALKNPFDSADDRARGAAFFQSQCASCHGADGKGGAQGPSLASGTFRHASSDEGLFHLITRGVPGTSMPGFSLNGREIWQIVAHVRSLSAGRLSVSAGGNAENGRKVLATQRCLNCHAIRGEGVPRGLDLSLAGERLSPLELHQALLDPNAEVAAEYWQWQAKRKDGAVIRGRRMNEDTFSVQVLLPDGKLASLDKSQLAEQTLERRSAMPSYRGKISDSDLNDLVAYLSSLRGNQ